MPTDEASESLCVSMRKGSFCNHFPGKEETPLAITHKRKEELLQQYSAHVSRSQAMIVTNYGTLRVPQMQELRRQLRQVDAAFAVTKNTLMQRALRDANLPAAENLLVGQTGVAFVFGDIPKTMKVLNDFARDSKILEVKGGILGNSVLDAEGVKVLNDLPTREQLVARVLGQLNAPLYSLVNVLNGPIRGLANVLNAQIQKIEAA